MTRVLKLKPREARYVDNELVRFNGSAVPFIQKEPFVAFRYGIRVKGSVVAGITATLYCWGVLYVHTVWVDERHRSSGLGTRLMNKVEAKAKKLGCTLSHLDTFDFQAKAFYEKLGYEIFGTLDECPPRHKRYYLKKTF